MTKASAIVRSVFWTEPVAWTVPGRLLLGILFIFPFGGTAEQIWSADGTLAIGPFLRTLELVVAVSLVAGFLIRVAVYPAVALLALHTAATAAGSPRGWHNG